MKYTIRYSDQIDWKKFQRLPAQDKRRIRSAIEKKLMVDPVTFGKPLRKSLFGCRSLRVGSYRVIFRIQGKFVDVLVIGHRSTVYSDSPV